MLNIVFPQTGCLVFIAFTSTALQSTLERRCVDDHYTYLRLEPAHYDYGGAWVPSQYVESVGTNTICDEDNVSTIMKIICIAVMVVPSVILTIL